MKPAHLSLYDTVEGHHRRNMETEEEKLKVANEVF